MLGSNAKNTNTIRPPVPRLPLNGVKENPLTKRLRALDNKSIEVPSSLNYGVYITTNEIVTSEVISKLSNTPAIPKSCHIGFSGWHNLDIMALRHSSMGVICDINPENALFLHQTLEILRKSDTRHEFIREMTKYVNRYERDDQGKMKIQGFDIALSLCFSQNLLNESTAEFSPADEIKNHLKTEAGWLANDSRFEHIKYLAMTDRIALMTENITETKKFIKLSQLLQDNGIQIDSLYVSNIGEYMHTPEERQAFENSVNALSELTTLMVDAAKAYYFFDAPELKQRVNTRKILNDNDKAKQWWWGKETVQEYLQRETPEEQEKHMKAMKSSTQKIMERYQTTDSSKKSMTPPVEFKEEKPQPNISHDFEQTEFKQDDLTFKNVKVMVI